MKMVNTANPQGENSDAVREQPGIKPAEVAAFVENDRLIRDIIAYWSVYLRSKRKDSTSLSKAEEAARQLDDNLGKERHGVKTQPVVGLYHSAGAGFRGATAEMASMLAIPMYGYTTLAKETAQFAADTIQHLHERRILVTDQKLPSEAEKNPSLATLIRKSYIPLPNPIDENMPCVGPIKLDERVYSLFSTWVKGPLLNDQLPDLNRFARKDPDLGARFKDRRLWIAAQMTAVWQAYPPQHLAKNKMPRDIAYQLKGNYTDTIAQSLIHTAEVLGISLTETEREKLAKTAAAVVEPMPIDSGNIGPYFDAALRNFIDEVGDPKGVLKAFELTVKDGSINESLLYDLTRRIDFSHVAKRPFSLYEEDASHITENWLARLSKAERTRYQAEITLIRQSFALFDSGKISRAAEIAESLDALKNGTATPTDIDAWKAYYDTYSKTIETMPWIRKVRQGELALAYASKAIRNQEVFGDDLSGDIRQRMAEARVYFLRSKQELPVILDVVDLKPSNVAYEGIPILESLLDNAMYRTRKGEFDKEKMLANGEAMLARYV